MSIRIHERHPIIVAAVVVAVAILANGILDYLDSPASRNYAACVQVGDRLTKPNGEPRFYLTWLKVDCWEGAFTRD